tara:strand:+ start:1312 stop:2469 length:1158 start_codon:yes stop_codon:yes gene_type:complete
LSRISPKFFFDAITKGGINFFTGVPDSLLKSFCFYLDDNLDKNNHIISANEGSALALGIGSYLATKKLPLVYLQNSGFGNLVNPLLSMADKKIYSIPGILMLGWRGEPGVKDEPQHIKQGQITLELLEIMNIPYRVFSPDMSQKEILKELNFILKNAKKEMQFQALVIKKDFFEEYISLNSEKKIYDLNRKEAIKLIINSSYEDDLIVATTGITSRELYEYREKNKQTHSNDFLVVGGMGHVNQIALGIAIKTPNRRIICLDGDGSIIMHMGSLTTIAAMKQKNFLHIVLNNGAHDSVGGQDTTAKNLNLSDFAEASGYKNFFSVSKEKDIKKTLRNIAKFNGPNFLEIKINKGWNKSLGRPLTSPEENKSNFMLNLAGKKNNLV